MSDYIFINDKGNSFLNIRGWLEQVIEELGFNTTKYIKEHNQPEERITPHNIRHTVNTYLAMNGEDHVLRMELLGQKSLSMQKRYTHFNQKFKLESINRLEERIFKSDTSKSKAV